jgi:hypothetical protein
MRLQPRGTSAEAGWNEFCKTGLNPGSVWVEFVMAKFADELSRIVRDIEQEQRMRG